MQLKTILNRVQKFKSFVYRDIRWAEEATEPTIEVEVHQRSNSAAICSGCGRRRPSYDTLPQQRFEFIPMWGIKAIGIDKIQLGNGVSPEWHFLKPRTTVIPAQAGIQNA